MPPKAAAEAWRREAATKTPAGAAGWRHTLVSLSNPDYRNLWLGLLLMMGAVQMQMIARGYLTYDITSSPFLLGLVSAGFALPMLSLSLFGGAVADRVDRKLVIQVGQAMNMTVALLIAVAITANVVHWTHLLVASMIQGAIFSFMMPARQAIIPQLVGRDMISNAVALSAVAMSVGTLVAPALAGILYDVIGPAGVYYVIAGMGLAAVLVTGLLPKTGGGPLTSDVPMLRDIKAGLSYISRSPLVLTLLAMGLGTALFAMPIRFLMPVLVVDLYHRGPESLGLLVSIMGVGSLVGALVIASLGRWRRGLLLILGTFLSGIALLMLALFPFYFAAAAIMVILGLGDSGRRTLNQALIMENVEDQYRGRVMSVFMLNFGLMPLGVLPAGLVAEFFGVQTAVGLLAVLLLVFAGAILLTQRRLREES